MTFYLNNCLNLLLNELIKFILLNLKNQELVSIKQCIKII